MRVVEDADLLEVWHTAVLPIIAANLQEYQPLSSIHLLRKGLCEEDASPLILVSMKLRNQKVENLLRQDISRLIPGETRSSLMMFFESGSIRRSIGDNLPPICKARNTMRQYFPDRGASIGIENRVNLTATLGGYLVVDGEIHILTVDHLITDDLAHRRHIYITHPSLQEAFESPQALPLREYYHGMKECCWYCSHLAKEIWEDLPSSEESELYDYPCPTALGLQKLKDTILDEDSENSYRIGELMYRSTMRSRLCEGKPSEFQVEMDWALFALAEDWRRHWLYSHKPLSIHLLESSTGLYFSDIIPEASVTATGRTSGRQTGTINSATCLINHGSRCTEEWTILRGAGMSLSDWISGGIGVDGDSGAWVIDQESAALYGMVWGRDRIHTDPICLFSPIMDVIADIKERSGAEKVTLPGNEPMSWDTPRERGKGKEREPFTVPTSIIMPQQADEDIGFNYKKSMGRMIQ